MELWLQKNLVQLVHFFQVITLNKSFDRIEKCRKKPTIAATIISFMLKPAMKNVRPLCVLRRLHLLDFVLICFSTVFIRRSWILALVQLATDFLFYSKWAKKKAITTPNTNEWSENAIHMLLMMILGAIRI